MQDRELYRQILGIETPWYVERVDLQLNHGEIHVYLDHKSDIYKGLLDVAGMPESIAER